MLISGAFAMCKDATSMATPNAISSPELADGRSHCASPDGQTIGLFGQALAPVSRSARPGSTKVPPTSVTCGLSSVGLSPSERLQSCLESRLRQRMGAYGSMEFDLIWKHWDMPSGLPICALRASARRTSDSDFGSLPIVKPDALPLSGWPTPNAMEGGSTSRSGSRKGELLIGGLVQGCELRERERERERESSSCRMGHAVGAGLEGYARHVDDRNKSGWNDANADGSTAATGGDGAAEFWSRFDVVNCRDSKARRIEPGTFPLAYGIPARVGRLRGYGNAIVPQVAAEFIVAYAEVKIANE
jgi:hypothetical protein